MDRINRIYRIYRIKAKVSPGKCGAHLYHERIEAHEERLKLHREACQGREGTQQSFNAKDTKEG
jgi:hypothetical protein